LSLGCKFPDHVAASETTAAGTKYHAFKKIMDRDEWIQQAPLYRTARMPHDRLVIAAWESFCIILHPDPKGQDRLRRMESR